VVERYRPFDWSNLDHRCAFPLFTHTHAHTRTHTERESEILLLGDEILIDTADERWAYQEENIAHGSSVRRDEESGHTEHFNCLGEGLVAVHLPDLPVALRDVIARREGVVEEPVSATGQSRGYPSRPPSSAPIALFWPPANVHARFFELQPPVVGIVIQEDKLFLLRSCGHPYHSRPKMRDRRGKSLSHISQSHT
jgi:hypothetical protein